MVSLRPVTRQLSKPAWSDCKRRLKEALKTASSSVLDVGLEEVSPDGLGPGLHILSFQPADHLGVAVEVDFALGGPGSEQLLGVLVAELGVRLLQLGDQEVLQHAALHAPEEVAPRVLPGDALSDHALGLHPPGAVVEIREGGCHRRVQRQQLLLPSLDLLLDARLLIGSGC